MGGTDKSYEQDVPKAPWMGNAPVRLDVPAAAGPGPNEQSCPEELTIEIRTSHAERAHIGPAGIMKNPGDPRLLSLIQGPDELATISGEIATQILECLRRGERYAVHISQKEEEGDKVHLWVQLTKW